MRSIYKFFTILLLIQFASIQGLAQLHPMEALGREIFNTFRTSNYETYFRRSIFSLKEDAFKSFLYGIRNKSIRNNLIALHTQKFAPNSSQSEKWEIAFEHRWRNELNHLSKYSPSQVIKESFTPIINEALEFGIQWETTKLLAIEAHLPVTWKNGRFHIKGDFDLDANVSNPRILFMDRNLNYRLTLDNLTYSKTFMIGRSPEDSEKSYNQEVLGNGSGQADILIRFSSQTPSRLFYFCPEQVGAGGEIIVKDINDMDKPNQRTDILLTFSYGQPACAYQIIIKDTLMSPKGAIFTERPIFLGQVPLPRGLLFPY